MIERLDSPEELRRFRTDEVRAGTALWATVLAAFAMLLLSACAAEDADDDATGAGPRAPTAEEAERFASTRLNAYQDKIRRVDGAVVTESGSVQISGWVDTVGHRGYGLVSGPGVSPFLALWSPSTVSAQSAPGVYAPVPIPADGWETTQLDPESSQLAAAHVLLVSLANDVADNPVLVAQSGVNWLREDAVGQLAVDVFTGPIPTGSTSSSYRYWIDREGNLARVEAKLDGVRWSSFTFAPADELDLEWPE